jgi:hypothetical protein
MKRKSGAVDRFVAMLNAGLAKLPPAEQRRVLIAGRKLLAERQLAVLSAEMAAMVLKTWAREGVTDQEKHRRLDAFEALLRKTTARKRDRKA